MEFYADRVEFCGVEICRGKRSQTKRRILDLLRKKLSNGTFAGYSSEQLAKEIGLKGGQKAVAGAIRDLRDHIVETLRKQAHLNCARQHVILSGGPGYRCADCVTVRDADEYGGKPQQGQNLVNSPGDGTVNGTVDGTVDSHDHGTVRDTLDKKLERRNWILEQVKKGRKMRAPTFATELPCSPRTVKRDLDALGDQIEFVGAPNSGYYRLRDDKTAS